ncbi:hypothetical protein ACHAW5_009822 [Stephanodiscus triporus]|uniref:Uncharacterized protein n=1 Tax=Stephanodiscus triporus TaxID=2934178 RepID=A0ABD3PLV8_9STRA
MTRSRNRSDELMKFPTNAVYGPGCTPDTLSGWDGRDIYEDVVQIATRDDEDGNVCSIEVMHSMNLALSSKNTLSIFSGLSSGDESQEEMASPRIDHSPIPSEANSLASPNSLMMDLSDLEHSLNDEVFTVKNWLLRAKSERDKLRRDKTSLMQQLAAEKQMRDSEVSRLQAEVSVAKAKGDHDRDHLWGEIRCLRDLIRDNDIIKEKDAAKAKTDAANLQKQVDSAKAEMKSLEEALVKEKSLSTIREMNKLEDVRKTHFEQMSKAIAELETKFANDLEEMSERKKAMLEEEIKAHADTANKLQIACSEKDHVSKELIATIRELDDLRAENKKYATLIDETNNVAKEEKESLRAELDLSRQAYDSAIAEVQTVNSEKEYLSSQLQVKNTELTSLQKQLKEAKSDQIHDLDHIKDQVKKLSELVEIMSNDRDKARADLKDSQAHVQLLTNANLEAKEELHKLKEETEKNRLELKALNEARKCNELYEEETKAEIKRLKKLLDESTGDILRSIQSNDSSQASAEASRMANGSRQDDGSNDILNSKILALPSLADEVGTEISVLDEAKTPGRDKSVDDKCDSLRDDIAQSRYERDALRRMADTLLPLADGNDMMQLESMKKEVSDLKTKLSRAEEAYIKVKVEKTEMLASVTHERDTLASQVKEMNARLLTNEPGNILDTARKEKEESGLNDGTTYTAAEVEDNAEQPEILLSLKNELATQVQQNNMVNEELWQLQYKLDAQVKENEKLSTELAVLRETVDSLQLPDKQVAEGNDQQLSEIAKDSSADLETDSEDRIGKLQSLLDLQVKENEKLSSELTALRAITTDNEADVAFQMSKDIEEIKQDHRIEIKLLKQEHAAIKTKAKLLAKEKDEIANAYEMEKISNTELESSLEDIVNLFQSERLMHDIKAKEHKIIKKRFSSLRKKRVPVDAAYKACRSMLDRLEESMNDKAMSSDNALKPRSESGLDTNNMINLLDTLTRAFDGPDGSEFSLASFFENFSSDTTQAEELAFKGMCLANKVNEMNLKVKMDQIAMLPAEQLQNSCTQPCVVSAGDACAKTTLAIEHYEDMDCLRTAYNSLQEKSKHLTKELEDSTKAFEDTITSYEAVIAKVKSLLSEKKQENDTLKSELEQARRNLENLAANMENGTIEDGKTIASLKKIHAETLNAHEEELNAYREAVDVLKRRLEEEEAVKANLNMEIDRLKTDFTVVVSQFEQELMLSCEASEKTLQKKREELDDAQAALSAKEKECNQLTAELEAVGGTFAQQISEYEKTVHSLHDKLGRKEKECNKLTAELEAVGGKFAQQISDYENTVHSLHDKLGQAESDRQQLESAFDQWKDSKEVEVKNLQNKLDGVIVSNKESMQLYVQMRADCTSLKEEKEMALEKNVELAANIATLTAENGSLLVQIEDQTKAARKADDLENLIKSLREEVRLAEEAKQKASNAADETQHELMKANKRHDDMVVYTQKLKAEHEERELSLKSNMDTQMLSMNEVMQSLQRQLKSIELEKEENTTMYKNDISLQQEEIQKLQTSHLDALKQVDTLSDIVSTLKATLASEQENAQILLSQFKTSEIDRKSHIKQKEELEVELASRLKSESALSERIRNLEGVETELASRIASENSKAKQIHHLEVELQSIQARIKEKEEELDNLSGRLMENANMHNAELDKLKSKMDEDNRKHTAMQERIRSLESHIASLQQEFKLTLNEKEEEASKLRVILQEAKGKLKQLHDQNKELKDGNNETLQSLQQMLNDAVRSRTNTDASLQESLQLLEQQKRIDIKRKGEISKLEQTVEILKSKERYLESYVSSLKKQTRRG